MFKTRLDPQGNAISAKTWHKLGDTFTDPEELRKHHEEKSGQFEEGAEGAEGEEERKLAGGKDKRKRERRKQRKCGNCYGAGEEGEVSKL